MKYICTVCRYVYDEEKEGKKFCDLPADWTCPKCHQPKSAFKPLEDPVELPAMFTLSYGLFVLFSKDGKKNNGCIVNNVSQVTDLPLQIQVTVQKHNYTCELIQKTHRFNLSILDESVPFEVFKRFGFQSGRNVDKFEGFSPVSLSLNGLYYLTQYSNAFISGQVTKEIDLGTHVMFIATVSEAKVLAKTRSVTYAYYHANIKPKPQPAPSASTAAKWVCRICGYVYDDAKEKVKFEDLPATWTCPLCHHPKSDFDKIA
jgi:flavin reductase (DIM6/NTAB) family NADH-FMN oxidoreductase RutF